MEQEQVKAFCHSAPIVCENFQWKCKTCGRDQIGFLGFLWWIAQKTETVAETLITKRKAVRKCGTCGEEGHQARKCPNKENDRSESEPDSAQSDDV